LRRRQLAADHHTLSGLPDLQEIAAPVEAELDDEVAGLRGHSQCYSARSRRNPKNLAGSHRSASRGIASRDARLSLTCGGLTIPGLIGESQFTHKSSQNAVILGFDGPGGAVKMLKTT
jgi:hypothetical protein